MGQRSIPAGNVKHLEVNKNENTTNLSTHTGCNKSSALRVTYSIECIY